MKRSGKRGSTARRLRITYLMATTNVTGGAKVILEHAHRLADRGHGVRIVSHHGPPDWTRLRVPLIQADVRVPLSSMVPPSDIVVATYWNHAYFGLHAAKLLDAVPVYFVQGDEFFYERFEDPERANFQKISDESYRLPMKLAVVSPVIQRLLRERYDKESVFLPAAVDGRIFHPRPRPHREKLQILVMGTDQLEFKGVKDAFEALRKVRESGRDFEVLRISAFPQENFGLPCTYVERPTQEELGRLYATSDLMITASHYESFPLPPLEAMASGTPVITTANEGVHTYAEAGVNCLMVPVRDPDAMAGAIVELLDRPDRRQALADEGLRTAARYAWDRIVEDIERQYLAWVDEPREMELAPAETRTPPFDRHYALMGKAFHQMARLTLQEGERLYAQGDLQRADAVFEEAQRLVPDWADPRINRAVLAWERGDGQKALALLEEAYRLAPRHPDVLANLGTMLAQLGRREDALSFVNAYLVLRPDDPDMKRLAEGLGGGENGGGFRLHRAPDQTVSV